MGKMKAIIVNKPGGSDQLQLVDMERPTLETGELLIEVKAAAVNRTDIINRESAEGYLNHPILGVEVAGVVKGVGGGVSESFIGKSVMGLVNGGGYAEYAVMPVGRAMVIPDHLTWEKAAAIPEVFLTAYQTLFWHGKLQKGDTVLIHAAGSGVGTAAIQLAKQVKGVTVIATAGTSKKLTKARALGADVCINYKQADFFTEVERATKGKGADVILDFVGAAYYEKNMKSIAVDGRWVLIGMLGGVEVESVDLSDLMQKRVTLIGTLLTPRTDAYKEALSKEFAENMMPLFTSGALCPVIDSVYPLASIRDAHERMEKNRNIGKIIIRI